MLSPESLVRLRPWVLRILIFASLALAAMGLPILGDRDLSETWIRAFTSTAILATACVTILIGMAHARRRERTGPAVFGILLTTVAVTAALKWIWTGVLGSTAMLAAVSSMSWALAWAFLLAAYAERVPAKFAFLQHATALSIAGFAVSFTVMVWTGLESGQPEQWSYVLMIMSFAGLTILRSLSHYHRSGLRAVVPMAHVASVLRSMDFYQRLGFRCENSFNPPQAPEPTWAWMEAPGGAQLMLACAAEPVAAAPQGVLFYVYCDDLPAKHAELAGKGLAVGPIEKPFYASRGEFRLTDPDGYALMLTHT